MHFICNEAVEPAQGEIDGTNFYVGPQLPLTNDLINPLR